MKVVTATFIVLLLAGALIAAGCGGEGSPPLKVAASKTLEETGILAAWVEDFEKRGDIRLEVAAVPSRHALEMARYGECDLLITDIPREEENLVGSGYVDARREIMRDDYVLVGPAADPAGAGQAETIIDAVKRIAESGQPFVLRDDGSGAAYTAQLIWSISGVEDYEGWLVLTDSGAREALREASLEDAYTLVDRSTWQQNSDELSMGILFEGDDMLINPYHVMVVSALVYPDTDLEAAKRFEDYLLSAEAARLFDLGAWTSPPATKEAEEGAGGGDE